ncbi:hypothetical protein [Yinghuangia sp. YIM S09857]|uniref:hypothetical protein n=1 Tax=Yinghuangia sp. YIM S09857 TaxID=3436929 RepID=UPI003F53099E
MSQAPPGVVPGDPFVEGIIRAVDLRELHDATSDGFQHALGREIPVNVYGSHLRSAQEAAIAGLHFARVARGNPTFTGLFTENPRAGAEGSPAYASFRTGEVVLNRRFFGEDGRTALLNIVDQQLGANLPEVRELGAIPVVLHEVAHTKHYEMMHTAKDRLTNFTEADHAAAAALRPKPPLFDVEGSPESAPSARNAALLERLAGAQAPAAHVPREVSAITMPMLVDAFGGHRVMRNKKEIAADAVMHLGIQGDDAPLAVKQIAGQILDRELTYALIAGAPGLRATASEMSRRLDTGSWEAESLGVHTAPEANREHARESVRVRSRPDVDQWRTAAVAAAGFPRESAPPRPQHRPALEAPPTRSMLEPASRRLPAVRATEGAPQSRAATVGFSAITPPARGSETSPGQAGVSPASGTGDVGRQPDTGPGKSQRAPGWDLDQGLGN